MGSGTVAILLVMVLVLNGVMFVLWKLMDHTTRSTWLLHPHVDEVRALLPPAPEDATLRYERVFGIVSHRACLSA